MPSMQNVFQTLRWKEGSEFGIRIHSTKAPLSLLQKVRSCLYDGRCEINVSTRHTCVACRLKKCFQSGMEAERIRRSSPRKELVQKTTTDVSESNLFRNLAETLPHHLVSQGFSLLTNEQRSLLTNLMNNYDLPKLLLMAEELNGEESRTPAVCSAPVNQALVQNFIQGLYRAAGMAFRSNGDFRALSFADRSVLLATAVDNITCLGGIYVSSQTQLTNHRGLMNHLENVYGPSIIQQYQSSTTFVNCDPILFKLALALFSVSSVSRPCHQDLHDEFVQIKPIFQIEERYAELTWKYLLYKYSFQEAVQRYWKVVRWFLAMSVLMYHSHSALVHVNDVHSLIEETELNLLLDETDQVLETDH